MRVAARRYGVALLVSLGIGSVASGWDEKGHVIVTELAVRLLPEDVPGFLRQPETVAQLGYLAVEPDRWRNLDDLPMGQLNEPDHYFDIDLLPLFDMTAATLPSLRYDYLNSIHAYKLAHPEKDFGYDRDRDREHSREWPGFAPYEVSELYVLLRSSWRTLNTYERYPDVSTPETLAACRSNVIHHMGLMSHYVGDLAQPLHTTRHHHGWVGDNPRGFSSDRGIHQLIDGGAIEAMGISLDSCAARAPAMHAPMPSGQIFSETVRYAERSFGLVEPLYQLEKDGAFGLGSPKAKEGKVFIEDRLATAAGFLAAVWNAAYRDAGIDEFRDARLRSIREARTAAQNGKAP